MEVRILAVALLVLLSGCAGQYFRDAGAPPAPAAFALETWPHRELWTGVVFNGDKIGFTRRAVRPAADAPGLFEIESEAVLRFRLLGIDKRVSLRALDRVRGDLTLASFAHEHEIDGSARKVSGSSDGRVLAFAVQTSGGREEHKVELAAPLYPSSALGFLPVLHGLKIGRKAGYAIFEGETQKVSEAEQEVLGFETSTLFEGPAFKVATRMMGLESTSWIAADGRPVFELGLNGVLVSALEDEATARKYLVEASLNKRDGLVDFSLLRVGRLAAARDAARMEIVLDGVPAGFQAPSEGGQRCARQGARLSCTVERSAEGASGEFPARYLRPSLAAPSNLAEIADLAKTLVADAEGEEQKIARILAWMDANIAKEAVDSFTAVEVLRERRGECQGHAYLFAALARASGIPARVVNGIVYSPQHGGFLYHSWNEAWIAGRGWQPVDATFGQAHADATHLKLLEGESAGDLTPLAGFVGRVKIASVSAAKR